MRYNQLGNTGLFVSEICLGTMTFGRSGQDGMWGNIAGMDQATADAIVERSLAAGVNFIDTADIYSFGESEEMLGQSLKNLSVPRKNVVLATKLYNPMSSGPNDRGTSRVHIINSLEASLERLQTDYIDLYQIHANDTVTPIDEMLRTFDDLISRGLVRYIGVSNWQAWRIAKALGVAERRGYARFESVQAYYSIAGRDLEREMVPMMNEEKVGLMVWSPLAGGLLSGKYGPGSNDNEGRRATFDFPPVDKDRAWACVAAMRPIAEKHGASVAAVALAYVLAKPFVTTVIVGGKRLEQIEQNLGAVKLKLDAEDLAKLDEASALAPEYPGWMLSRQAVHRVPQPFEPKA
ncbi:MULTISPECIES: aldo/keto reductase [Burkholderia]|jgi:aryl-alcohol dehydrogenase-like predicted oxidoreductase|uniref:Aldo/keto reductase n=2 Tax=Burkholderia gladioli TaxID=28095 RepID=A0AAP1UXI5_BURGA|nr:MULTISPECIES: aldo/keto reductase [Burkholderia]AEA63085.1 Putative aldo/keto reductase [Burkholderia gladioli BSR3]AJW95528.1 aldo/keto reductase family protein [Burkholderia gladioli]ASD82898.1 aldo/keto reductase [Burkholderia gladioli pv. gladioli]AWY50333.1 aldo/keto reductase [Burkholderia gladioli pv. gladioli]KAF1059605.1 Aldo-keto reductase IolS [Burkholderia gladioli]